MRILVFVHILMIAWLLPAQNIIPNPGFDDLTECPFDVGQILFTESWSSASNGTPDLYNECSIGPFLQVPYAGRSIDSYQLPRSGTGYSSIVVYNNNNSASGSTGNSEYIEAPLSEPMQAGKVYYLEFYVSPDFTPIRNNGFTDAVGMALSDTFYYREIRAMEALPLEPDIENRGTVIKDTVGWTRISGCYAANGGEKYAIIGNFRSTNETLVEFKNPTFPFLNSFYIEDVLITPFDPLPDTILLCEGSPEELNAGFLDATYLWSTGETDSVITVTQAGQYTIEAFMENCILQDKVIVLDTKETGNLPTDILICQDETLWLSPPMPGVYHWSDGTQGGELAVTTSGYYEVTVINDCGEFVFSTEVEAEECDCNIYIPNVFSPNGDGINDFLEVYTGCDFEYRLKRFMVFDRWGGQVYSSAKVNDFKWDGTYSSNPLPSGVYIWSIEYEIERNGYTERQIETGDVTLLR